MAISHVHTSSSRRILIVDDDPQIIESISVLFELEGHQTRSALSGPEALERGGAFKPDLVLLDIGMSPMDGFDVASAMRTTDWGRGVVLAAMTGRGPSDRYARCGFDRYLFKPVSHTRCVDLISEIDAPAFRLRRERAALKRQFEALKRDRAVGIATFVRLELELTRRFLDASAITRYPVHSARSYANAQRALSEAEKWIARGAGTSEEDRHDLNVRLVDLKRRLASHAGG